MAASVVTVDRNQKAGVLPILKGFGVTLKVFFDSLFRRQTSTIEFPEKKRNVSSRYRGIHVLTEREDGTPKCVACFMCATVCPAECIYIESGERPEKTIEKYPTRFEIDLLRCVYCGFCVDACPEEAIIMSRENDLVGTTPGRAHHRPRPPDGPQQAGRARGGLPAGRPRRAAPRPPRRARSAEDRARHRARHAGEARLAPSRRFRRLLVARPTRSSAVRCHSEGLRLDGPRNRQSGGPLVARPDGAPRGDKAFDEVDRRGCARLHAGDPAMSNFVVAGRTCLLLVAAALACRFDGRRRRRDRRQRVALRERRRRAGAAPRAPRGRGAPTAACCSWTRTGAC